MTMRDPIPWGRNRNALVPSQPEETSPVLTLHREMNRLFDDFFRGFDLPLASRLGWSNGRPHVEVSETEKEVKVVAELPGMEEKDVELTLRDGVLTLKGEKQAETNASLYTHPCHGRFHPPIDPLPD